MNELLVQLDSVLKEKIIFTQLKDGFLDIPLTAHQPSEDEIRNIISSAAERLCAKFDVNVESRQGIPPFVVRVAGFSAYFQDMHTEVQDQIIARTKQRL